MRIAFCGHSHHRTTGSSRFLLQALRGLGPVEEHWVESWRGGPAAFDAAPLLAGGHDAVVIWQMEALAVALAERRLPNVTFFPMYDSCHAYPDSFWRRLSGLKVVSFCSALHARVLRLGVRSHHLQYFPEAPATAAAARGEGPGLAGYFWQRTQDVTWSTIRALVGEAEFRQFTLHDALDPSGGSLVPVPPEEARRLHLRTTRWFPSSEEQRADLLRHDVYFAPRLREGIGMSFLEAMAMGQLVVAPDRPTMNEYLVSGVNGLLYDPEHPAPLDFSEHLRLGRRARRHVELGRERWTRSLPALLELIATPTRETRDPGSIDGLDPRSLGPDGRPLRVLRPATSSASLPAAPAAQGEAALPLVTVASRRGARRAAREASARSVLAQAGLPLELMLTDDEDRQTLQLPQERPPDGITPVRWVLPGSTAWSWDAAIDAASGRYLLFLEEGDRLPATDTLSAVLRELPGDHDPVVIGHHVLRDELGADELRPAADFLQAYQRLRRGELSWSWLAAAPALPAVLWPLALLREQRFRADLPATMHLELLCRLAGQGARFHHSLAVMATRARPRTGVRARLRLLEEWGPVACEHTDRPDLLPLQLRRMRAEARGRDLHELPARDLVLGLGRTPGAFRELKRRFRSRAVRRASTHHERP
jgi:hypothetical protein